MGNCQAAEAAMVVIQHPGGRVDRFYWPPTAGEVMKSNPGHYVALVTLCVAEERRDGGGGGGGSGTVRFTRVRLLKPKDTLFLGQAYRLVTSQEVAKALRARKQEKMKRMHTDLNNNQQQQQLPLQKQHQQQKQQLQLQRSKEKRNTELLREARELDAERINHQGVKQVVERQKTASSAARARQWRPSLQSISEFGS